jgi:hypothetical protein
MKKQLIIFILSCGVSPFAESLRTDEQLNGVAWVQTSAEYRVSTVQAFRLAALRVKEAFRYREEIYLEHEQESITTLCPIQTPAQ